MTVRVSHMVHADGSVATVAERESMGFSHTYFPAEVIEQQVAMMLLDKAPVALEHQVTALNTMRVHEYRTGKINVSGLIERAI